jgi:hypothetical protein
LITAEKRYQAAGLSKKDQELVDKLLPATNQSWFDKAASLFGKQPKVVVEPQAFRELSSNYTKKQELLKQRNIREEAIQNEQKYLSDLHETVIHQITNLKDNTSSFTDGFYKNNGQRHEGKDLQVHLPSAADKRAEVLKHANQANNLQTKLQEAKRELSTMDVNNPDPAAKVIRERKEREVADLGTNIKVAQNTVMDLLKAGNNEQLNEYLETSHEITKKVKEEKATAKKEINALIGETPKQPVPLVTPNPAEATSNSATQPAEAAEVEKPAEGKAKTTETETDDKAWTVGGWFRGTKDGEVLKEGFTPGGIARSILTGVAGISIARKIWSWLFPEDEITRAQLAALKARGGAV